MSDAAPRSERMKEGRPDAGRPFVREVRTTAWGPLDAALAAYEGGREDAALTVRTDVADPEEMTVAHFYRAPTDMGPVERTALAAARGRVLDVGAGAGAFARPLSEKGLEVTALEILPTARRVLESRGLTDVRDGGLEAVDLEERFDTVLVMMNGVGLCGTVSVLPAFLAALANVLEPGGQVLVDSTDPRDWDVPDDGRYPGEVHMQLVFNDEAGPPFPFLFVDEGLLGEVASLSGLRCAVLARDPDGRYLAGISRKEEAPADDVPPGS
ncbi:MAG: class I SAM-dependent methyltransferase [Gemmatimonadetes bacterium]|nr:class I SAM-dependent methyltransferase [Gemmatimonadota bacterium]